ncbi:MAG: hypothetical protein IJY71_02060 [Clostridia bacterium]|nr:hypothetical protein [Clostridia bacterium]
MAHSKKLKRGKSFYVENWNPSAKKFINTCVLCGAEGYNPSIDEEGFLYNEAKTVTNHEHYAIHASLTSILKPLPLDSLGRCPDCAKRMDKT